MDVKGFTLIELVISITLVSLIMVILASALWLGYRSVQSGDAVIEKLERRKNSFAILQSQVQSIVPVTETDEEGATNYIFSGGPSQVVFPSSYSITGAGYVLVSYTAVAEDDGSVSLYAYEQNPLVETGSDTAPIRLVSGLSGLSFGYFGHEAGEEKGEWKDEWDNTESLPEMIDIRMDKSGRITSMPLMVRARKKASAFIASSVMPRNTLRTRRAYGKDR